jgi:hypothetical protein
MQRDEPLGEVIDRGVWKEDENRHQKPLETIAWGFQSTLFPQQTWE